MPDGVFTECKNLKSETTMLMCSLILQEIPHPAARGHEAAEQLLPFEQPDVRLRQQEGHLDGIRQQQIRDGQLQVEEKKRIHEEKPPRSCADHGEGSCSLQSSAAAAELYSDSAASTRAGNESTTAGLQK